MAQDDSYCSRCGSPRAQWPPQFDEGDNRSVPWKWLALLLAPLLIIATVTAAVLILPGLLRPDPPPPPVAVVTEMPLVEALETETPNPAETSTLVPTTTSPADVAPSPAETPQPAATPLPTDSPTPLPPTPADTPSPEPTTVPTATATVPPLRRTPDTNGVLVFEENFEADPVQAQPFYGEDLMTFDHVRGRGLLTGNQPGIVMPLFFSNRLLKDFSAEVDFRAPVAGPGSGYGFIFRSLETADGDLPGYYLALLRPADGTASLQAWDGAAWQGLARQTIPAGLLDDSGFNSVRLEVEGSDFALFANDTFLLQAQDDRFSDSGMFGFAIVPGRDLSEGEEDFVHLRNLQIYHPSSTVTAATTPVVALSATPQPSPTEDAEPGDHTLVIDFDQNPQWRRSDQPYGRLEPGQDQVHTGNSSGKITYHFDAVEDNFVVFEARPPVQLVGEPSGLVAWVFGDGSGHFLNAWLSDTEGERRAYTFGRLHHQGWQPMTAWFDDEAEWPNGHISGPDNGKMDFPVSFDALVLDGVPDGQPDGGIIYIDDLRTTSEPLPTSPLAQKQSPTPIAQTTPEASGPTPALSGRIAFPVYASDRRVYDVFVARPDGSEMVRILDYASQPALSPDGRRLALRRWQSDDRGIVVMDTYGGNQKRLTNFLEDALPSWSPDGQILAFMSRREADRRARVYETGSSGGSDWQLQQGSGPVYGEYATWLTDDQIVYRTVFPDNGLATMDSNGSGMKLILKDNTATAPAVAPNSSAIAFMSQSQDSWDIYRINPDGSGLNRLTDHAGSDGLPAWSPDGLSIAFVSNRDGLWSMWAMNADGSNQQKLFDLPGAVDGLVANEPGFSSRGWVEERVSWGP
ncbi:MAG: flagellar filament outer layer protein FlaA [Chloroflexota bacterium]|nr:flagellar filament outer layer protein FlaA [Chloroflexota bacterium]